MKKMNNIFSIIEIPKEEKIVFEEMIKEMRKKYIKKSSETVDDIFKSSEKLKKAINLGKVSKAIHESREEAYNIFLKEEAEFNRKVIEKISIQLKTPKNVIDNLIKKNITNKSGKELTNAIRKTCGEYAGIISPYIYALSLSNTQSRRSRAGKTFESIIYKIYEIFEYPYDSQSKLGREVFDNVGLGKKVDSVLPSLEEFKQQRNKTIIGAMKTTLRERWQEVAEEIERTKIPEIHLLTVDTEFSKSKLKEMGKHNIVIVALKEVKEKDGMSEIQNIISFEDYFFNEIPQMLKHWKK